MTRVTASDNNGRIEAPIRPLLLMYKYTCSRMTKLIDAIRLRAAPAKALLISITRRLEEIGAQGQH